MKNYMKVYRSDPHNKSRISHQRKKNRNDQTRELERQRKAIERARKKRHATLKVCSQTSTKKGGECEYKDKRKVTPRNMKTCVYRSKRKQAKPMKKPDLTYWLYDKILDCKYEKQLDMYYFLIKWTNSKFSKPTWEPEFNLYIQETDKETLNTWKTDAQLKETRKSFLKCLG